MKANSSFYRAFLAMLWAVVICTSYAVGQSIQNDFGKNRVQYHTFEWWQYETKNFIVYWYAGGRNLGQVAIQMAEEDYEEIKNLLEYDIDERVEILVYNDLTDLKQSNIGNDEVFLNVGGVTKIIENKLFVYFDGNHAHLRRQIREGIAQVYVNHMMFGSNLQEVVQNAVMLNLPEWYTQGLVSYAGEMWNTDLDDQLRDFIQRNEPVSFMQLATINPRLAGHSLWYFIASNYGKATVSNLLYLTRMNRSVESGFLYVLGGSYYQIVSNWLNFYRIRYGAEQATGTLPDASHELAIKNKYNLPITHFNISPDGKQVAYTINEIGRVKLYIQDVATGTRTLILQGGQRNIFQTTDTNYPLFVWAANSKDYGILYEKRDRLKMFHTFYGEPETIEMPAQYERVVKMDYIGDRQLVLTAMVEGHSNIYLFDPKVKQTKPITSDYHDDLDAAFVSLNGKKGVVFASNRPDSTLKIGQRMDTLLPLPTYDLYYYDLEAKTPTSLVRLTNTPHTNERQPAAVNQRYFSFISNENGINNRYLGYIDTVLTGYEKVVVIRYGETIVLPVDSVPSIDSINIDTIYIRPVRQPKGFVRANTALLRNISHHHTAPRKLLAAELIHYDGRQRAYLMPIDTALKVLPLPSAFQRILERKRNTTPTLPALPTKPADKLIVVNPVAPADSIPAPVAPLAEPVDTGKIDIDNYFFQSEFEDSRKPATVTVDTQDGGVTVQQPSIIAQPQQTLPQKFQFRPSRIVPYRPKFKTDFLTTQVDNSLLGGGVLQPLDANNPFFDYPVPSIMLLGGVEDLFEDYRLQGGARVPTSFNGVEYFLQFDQRKKRLDTRYAFYRRMRRNSAVLTGNNVPFPGYEATYKVLSNIAEVQLRYPLDVFQSLRASFTARTDRQLYLATDSYALDLPDVTQQRVGLRLEYVYDNVREVSLNIRHGAKAKAYAEVVKRFNLQLTDGASLDFNEGVMAVLGVDARYYQRLDRHSIFASRLSAAGSFGSEKILYYIGGVENWILPRFNTDIPTPDMDGFAYQTVVNNLRGFQNNIRNGNSYALINNELRIPIFKYLPNYNRRSNLAKNFQLVGFFDVGTAWQGLSPFNDDNPLNTIIIENPNSPVTVKVNYFRHPIVAGYGIGARTTLFGYFLRMDYAWGIETGVIQEPRVYIAIGTDF